ncbi:MAG: phage holin family protein [Chitinophagales bacterium]|nr:phage holin family protein [Chitinophagales bacterium]
MKQKDQILESAGEVYGYTKVYIKQQLEYYKLEIAERLSLTLSSMITLVMILMVMLLFVIFLSLSLAFFLSDKLGSYSQGFLIVSGVHAFVAVVVVLFRRQLITNPILSRIIKTFFQKENENS